MEIVVGTRDQRKGVETNEAYSGMCETFDDAGWGNIDTCSNFTRTCAGMYVTT